MSLFLWLAGLAFCSWVFTAGMILALPTARRLRDEGGVAWVLTYPAYIFLAFGLLWDVVFNLLIGSVVFREIPREFTFTERVQRHYDEGSEKAIWWAALINRVDPGHIDQ